MDRAPRKFMSGADILHNFVYDLHDKRNAMVLELGTKRSNEEVSTVHRVWAADDATYILSDVEQGLDVDIVADAHRLSDAFRGEEFDAVIACSVFEHLRRPWIVAREIGKILKPGGRVFIQTHFAFPLHGFPNDYWRFSREALEILFDWEAGFRLIGSGYDFPAQVHSMENPQAKDGEAYLNSVIVAERLLPPDR